MTDTITVAPKTYIGISRDHSRSMSGIRKAATDDYNNLIEGLKEGALTHNQNLIASTVECGYDRTDKVRFVEQLATVQALQPIPYGSYSANGCGTPLYDSVGALIEQFESLPDANDPNVSFLLLIITDGGENASTKWRRNLGVKIKQLQATDRWTFTFRVPRGYGRNLVKDLSIYEGNVEEWEQTSRDMQRSSTVTRAAVGSYIQARSTGKTSVKTFYANVSEVSKEEIQASLTDVSAQVSSFIVGTAEEGANIRNYIEGKTGSFVKGAGFYELVPGKKNADKVQDYKMVLIKDKNTGVVYYGAAARQLIGLPKYGDARIRPENLGDYEVYIQSTSVNRKLPAGTRMLYWPQAANHK